jgi:hypothetical protein
MRTPRELIFRVRQESANLLLWATPPKPQEYRVYRPVKGLPEASAIAERLRRSVFAEELQTVAGEVLGHRFQLLGSTLGTGAKIEWRCDYKNGTTSSTQYFRAVPYLDARRVGDHKWIWELNRHQHLVTLAQAYLLTSDQGLLSEIETQINSWFDQNPFMCGINWCSALEVAFRALSWIWVYHLVGDRLRPEFRSRLLNGLDQHGRYLEHNLSVYFSPNTHLLGEAVALEALGTLLPSLPPAHQWKRLGSDIVARQMDSQVREDGSHFEQSSYYQVYALDMFLFHRLLSGPNAEFDAKLAKMADYLAALMGPARTLPFLGDDDGGRFFHPYGQRDRFGRATLATCSLLLRKSWPYEEVDLQPQALWWLGVASASQPPSIEKRAARASELYRGCGTAIMVSDATQVVFDCGPLGRGSGGHSHSDALSIVARNGPEDVLLDPGTYTYVGDVDQRDWFRGSAAHSTVRVDGRDQAVPAGPFRWTNKPDVQLLEWSSSVAQDFAHAICRYHAAPGTAPVQHRRAVLWFKRNSAAGIANDVLIVRDVIDGPAGRHVIEQFWHPGEPTALLAPNHVLIGSNNHLVIPDGSGFDAVAGWRSPTFGEKIPSQLYVARSETELPVTMWAALVFGDASDVALAVGPQADEATLRLGTRALVLTSNAAGGLMCLSSAPRS